MKIHLPRIRSLCQKILSDTEVRYYGNQESQKLLFLYYQLLHNMKQPLPKFEEIGFRAYSQVDEDGLLLYIFSLIGFTSKVCVDVGSRSPYGANTTNLLCNWGFTGLLIEGQEDNVKQDNQFFAAHPDTWIYPPKTVCAWVTAENINQLIRENGISGDIDLFCLDLDGIDYWIWKALSVIHPRVVVVEYVNFWVLTNPLLFHTDQTSTDLTSS